MAGLVATEMMIAGYIGVARNVYALVHGLTPAADMGWGNSWQTNIDGACGEMFVAKTLGMHWCPLIGDIRADDVGPYQVRTNGSRKWTDTILRPASETCKGDYPDRPYIAVLALAVPSEFEIMGWIWGRDGMAEQWLRKGSETDKRPPAYFVPRAALRPMSELPTVEQTLAERAP